MDRERGGQAAASLSWIWGTRGVDDEKVTTLKITAACLNKGRTNVGDTSGNRLRATAVNEHNLADGGYLTELFGREDWDPNAAMARRPCGHNRTSVNRNPLLDVVRIVEQSQGLLHLRPTTEPR